MLYLVENTTHLRVSGPPEWLDAISEHFKFRPNGYLYAPSYERWKISKGEDGWDGYVRPLRRTSASSGMLLRGFKHKLLEFADAKEYDVDASKLLRNPFAGITLDDIPDDLVAGEHKLDAFQQNCVYVWVKNAIAVNRVTVSGGKTMSFAGAAAFIKRSMPSARFLYLTDRERLVTQVTKEMKRFLPDFEVGQFGGGFKEKDAKDMVVCTIAMLNKHHKTLVASGWFNSFTAVLYDECQSAGSTTSKKVLMSMGAFFRFGASDTTKEADPSRHNDIMGLLGPTLSNVESAPLIESGRIAVPHIYVVDRKDWMNRFNHVSYKVEPNSPAFVLSDGTWQQATYLGPVYKVDDAGKIVTVKKVGTVKDENDKWIVNDVPVIETGRHRMELNGEEFEVDSDFCLLDRCYDRSIIRFKERNDLIVKWAKHYHARNLQTLVVCTRTLHVRILEALIAKEVNPDFVRVLYGKHTTAQRNEGFEWLKATPGAVLISPLVKVGVSINELRAGVIADYVSDWEAAKQIIGRFIRKKNDGENRAEITWFADNQHRILRNGFEEMYANLSNLEGFQFYRPAPEPEDLEKKYEDENN